ncbi:MAG: hypothetical protein HVN35_04315 [Methanobacteriaceae archaeon]|nr:hypothetical protein [Methanobacteriaceae archaeon]
MDREPLAKRGRCSGAKKVMRCHDCHQNFHQNLLLPLKEDIEKCECVGRFENLPHTLIEHEEIIYDLPEPAEIRGFVLEQPIHLPDL